MSETPTDQESRSDLAWLALLTIATAVMAVAVAAGQLRSDQSDDGPVVAEVLLWSISAISFVFFILGSALLVSGFLVIRRTPRAASTQPSQTTDDAQTEAKPFAAEVLLLGAGGVLAVLGSFLPWVTVATVFSVTGVEARWGLASLFCGLAAIAIGAQFGTGRFARRSFNRPLATVSVALGILSLAAALYVGFAVRDAVAESEAEASASEETESTGNDEFDAGLDELAKGFEEAFKIRAGDGVYVTLLGGLLVSAGGVTALRRVPR